MRAKKLADVHEGAREMYRVMAHAWRDFPEEHFIGFCTLHEEQYRSDKNPLHVWNVYSAARQRGAAIPHWVLAYLDRVAENLFSFSIPPPTEGQVAAVAAAALGFPKGGRRNAFVQSWNEQHRNQMGREVQQLLDEGHKLYIAAEEVGRRHPTDVCRLFFPHCRQLSRQAVEAHYKAYLRALPSQLPPPFAKKP